ncbi:MAG: hypothetical protein D6707_11375, partial [Bacteroidetes bacterium]
MKKIGFISFFLFCFVVLQAQQDTVVTPQDSVPSVMIQDTAQANGEGIKNPNNQIQEADTTESSLAQNDSITEPVILDDTVIVSFVKYKTVIEAGKVYFNVLVIKNLFDYPVTGDIQLWYPKEWRNFSKPPRNVTIQPDDSVLIPLRFTMPPNMYGGLTYVLNAIYKANGEEYSGNAYLQIKEISDWTAIVPDREIYFNKYYPSTDFTLKISNKGNAKELYK